MHDLEAVTVVELGTGPLRARDNLAIEFHRDAVALHAELLDQLGQPQGVRKFLLFAVDEQVHGITVKQFRISDRAVSQAKPIIHHSATRNLTLDTRKLCKMTEFCLAQHRLHSWWRRKAMAV